MAYMLFALFIAAPLVLLGVNLGSGAVGLTKAAKEARPDDSRPRRTKMNWPARPRRAVPMIDPRRSLSPLAAFRRWRQRPRRANVHVRSTPTVRPQEATAPATPPITPVVLPVTASPTGFRPAPASAFTAGPALTPRRQHERAFAA